MIMYACMIALLIIAVLQHIKNIKLSNLRIEELEEVIELGEKLNEQHKTQLKAHKKNMERLGTVIGKAHSSANIVIQEAQTNLTNELNIWRSKRQDFETVINNKNRERKKIRGKRNKG